MSSPAFADEAEEYFVEANILGIFYHELGHALIDVMLLPIFGQEEDAADVASVLFINQMFEPEVAVDLAYDIADGFWAEAVVSADFEIPFWATHGPDEQRFYNTVCLFYGADPDNRETFASDMELPQERAESCPEEYDLALDSWGAVFDQALGEGNPIEFDPSDDETLTARLLADEVKALNELFAFPETIEVITESCGEANAFYDLGTKQIIMCEEFEDHLRRLFKALNTDED